MIKDFVIIIQGPGTYSKILRERLKEYPIIFSTWIGEESYFESEDIVIFNQIPEFAGPANLNYQKISTLSGLKLAKENGYKMALKLRSDVIPNNIDKLIESFDRDSLNFLCWHCHEVYPECPGYLVDHLMAGEIDNLIKLWDIEDMSWCNVPEIHITQQYITKLIDKVKIQYFLDALNDDNELYWIKRKINLSSYKENRIHDNYRKYDFSLSTDHLTENYTRFLKKIK
jgi:hypothetical protein